MEIIRGLWEVMGGGQISTWVCFNVRNAISPSFIDEDMVDLEVGVSQRRINQTNVFIVDVSLCGIPSFVILMSWSMFCRHNACQ